MAAVAAVIVPAVPAAQAAPDHSGPLAVVAPGASTTLSVVARPDSAPFASPEGPGTAPAPRGRGGSGAATGEGLVWLTLKAPADSWASALDTSAVVDVAVDGGPAQQVVVFYGGQAFTYEGFVGPLSVGRHQVSVHVSQQLSHSLTAPPAVDVVAVRLVVVPATSPAYWAEAYAPVLYGRSTSAVRYTPLLTDAATVANADGSHIVSYALVISAHDQGDSIVPAYQWGTWGRMTDLVSILTETVAPNGSVTSATYASCGCESLPYYPDRVMSPQETSASFAGTWWGHHPVLRDATATNYLSDQGTTAFRVQAAPVAAPPAGDLRSAVMDLNPWTYYVDNQELPREHVISTDPATLAVGDVAQYAIIDANLTVTNGASVAVDIRLAGDPTWYSNDYRQATAGVASTFPFHGSGHWRTVVKLPPGWGAGSLAAVQLRLDVPPGTADPSVVVHSFAVLEITPGWSVVAAALPPLGVVTGTSIEPVGVPG